MEFREFYSIIAVFSDDFEHEIISGKTQGKSDKELLKSIKVKKYVEKMDCKVIVKRWFKGSLI